MLTWIQTTRLGVLLFCLIFIAHSHASAADNSVDLQWSPNSESDLAGYNVYHGTQSGVYGFPSNVGNVTNHHMNNLAPDQTHYFAITAYDFAGNESNPSQEVSKVTQAVAPPTLTSPDPNSTFDGTTAMFTWAPNDSSVSEWWLYVGTSQGAFDVTDTGSLGTQLSTTITNLPTNGSTVWTRLWYRLSSDWDFVDIQHTAANISTTFPLTIMKHGSGSGTITSNTGGLDCGSSCTASFTENSTITLSSTAASDSDFEGWSGGGCSGTGSCMVNLTQATTVTATFVAYQSSGTQPTIHSPQAESSLVGSSATFTWAPNDFSVSEWWLYVGTSKGANDLVDSGSLTKETLSQTVSGLPTNGSTIWAQLWWRTSDKGPWMSADFQYSTASASTISDPALTAPAPGATLTGSSATFTWAPNGSSVSEWWLYVGTSKGANDLVDSGSLTKETLSQTVSGLPTNGSTIWAQLWWRTSDKGPWMSADFQYSTASASTISDPALTAPAPGAILTGGSATFTWTPNGSSVSEWWLYVGTSKGANDLVDSGSLTKETLSQTVSGLPTNGSTIWAQLWWRTSDKGPWMSADFQYSAPIIASTISDPALTAPAPGAILTGSSATFTWAPNGSSVSEWWLYVGTSKGANDLVDSGSLTKETLSQTVSGLPTNGSTIWAQLWWRTSDKGPWMSADFQYSTASASTTSDPALTAPAPGATLTGRSATFTWAPNGSSVSEWWLYVGTSPGANDLVDSGSLAGDALSKTIIDIPRNGSRVWAQLWWRTSVDGPWMSADYWYMAPSSAQ